MTTPIVDFLREYSLAENARFHMPGHKGTGFFGCEKYDITEIGGADVLYSASGIIAESENNASSLFGTAHTFYSTEGSTLAIKAMLSLAAQNMPDHRIVAARNCHKAFVYAVGWLGLKVDWIYPENNTVYGSAVTPESIEKAILAGEKPCAVYITSPDYLGHISDIQGISRVCQKHSVPLLADNAHGAYTAFLESTLHPIHLGADACCDSAHKTLPVLTGGAYLHISKNAPELFCDYARSALDSFASTSPSYLILQSLDLCNKLLASGYAEKLKKCISKLDDIKQALIDLGISIYKSEPLKFVIETKKIGYIGTELADILRIDNLEVEFSDDDYIVAMFSPDNEDRDFDRLIDAIKKLPKKQPIESKAIYPSIPQKIMSIRSAMLSKSETVYLYEAEGRVCASPTVSCPPAVPVVMSGELVSKEEVLLLEKYGIDKIEVVKI